VRSLFLCLALLFAFTLGCAHAPRLSERDARALFEEICRAPVFASEVSGEVWITAQTPDAHGSFPAVVRTALSPARTLNLEVTNLLGGTVARVQLDEEGLRVFQKGRMRESARETYAGIPLRFGVDLFLGRRPCPQGIEPRLRIEGERLFADLSGESFEYGFRSYGKAHWVDSVAWVRGANRVEFVFDRPEDPSGAPLEWLTKSSQGEVRVRWKRRNVLR
jgi:hypothetical protein